MKRECYIDRCIALKYPDEFVRIQAVGRYPIGRFEEAEIEFIKSETFVDVMPPSGLKRCAESGMEGCVVYVFRTEEDIRLDSVRNRCWHVELLQKGSQFIDDEYLSHIKTVADRTLAARSLEQNTYESSIVDTQINIDTADGIDIADFIDESKGKMVEMADYLDYKINKQRPKGGKKRLQNNRSTIAWSVKNPSIGRDVDGNICERTGDNQYNYRYQYFLLHENNLTLVTK